MSVKQRIGLRRRVPRLYDVLVFRHTGREPYGKLVRDARNPHHATSALVRNMASMNDDARRRAVVLTADETYVRQLGVALSALTPGRVV